MADNGEAFRAALSDQGYGLARGDKRDFVVVDPRGGVHSIRSAVPGLKAAEIRARLADLKPAQLPSVAEAQAAARAAPPRDPPQRSTDKATDASEQTPPRSTRPPRPEARRYEGLKQSFTYQPPSAALARADGARTSPGDPAGASHKTVPPATPADKPPAKPPAAPQPRPTPPTWAREPPPMPRPTAAPGRASPQLPPAPTRPAAPDAIDVRHRAEAATLSQRQADVWQTTASGIETRHQRAKADLAAHHGQRMASLTEAVDQRLAELNGLSSRAGALFDRASRDREIAYLVAQRQRMLATEKARQEKVQADLQRSHEAELSQAGQLHAQHSALQRTALARRQDAQKQNGPNPRRGRRDDLER